MARFSWLSWQQNSADNRLALERLPRQRGFDHVCGFGHGDMLQVMSERHFLNPPRAVLTQSLRDWNERIVLVASRHHVSFLRDLLTRASELDPVREAIPRLRGTAVFVG